MCDIDLQTSLSLLQSLSSSHLRGTQNFMDTPRSAPPTHWCDSLHPSSLSHFVRLLKMPPGLVLCVGPVEYFIAWVARRGVPGQYT